MNNPVTVQVVKSLDELLGDLAYLLLSQVSVVLQDFEQLALGEFSDDAELVGSLERVKQKDDVLMVQTFQNLDLLPQVIHLLLSFASTGHEV